MPPDFLITFLDREESLPAPDAVLGLEEPEAGGESMEAPSADELLKNADVAAVVKAAHGLEPVR